MTGTRDSFGRVLRDVTLLGVLLGGLNFALEPGDAGWLNLNPTPWLLPAVLIGARYGAMSGTMTGLLTVLGLSLVNSSFDGVDARAFAAEHRYLFTGLVLGGFLAGQLNHLLRGDSAKLQRGNDQMKDQVERLRSELGLVNETRHELQQRLALCNAPLACLDAELRKLISLQPDEIFGALLHLLHRLAGVTSAGIYSLDGEMLRRDAVIHPTAPLGIAIPLAHSRLASRALEEKSIASLSHPLECSRHQPFLAAIPLRHDDRDGVLLIQDMLLEFFEWRNLARIEAILHWTLTMRRHAESFGDAAAAHKLLPLDDFMVFLAQALETEQTHRLPSIVLRFDLAEGSKTASSDGRQITRALPATALTALMPRGGLVSLLPFTAGHSAEAIAAAIEERVPAVRASHHLVAGPGDIEALWMRIMEP